MDAISTSTDGEGLLDFAMVGAPKSATTSLYHLLDGFEDIFLTTPKEPAFFSDPSQYTKGMEWYRSLFEAAPHGAVRGEASTTYARYPFDTTPNTRDPWPDLQRLAPNLKIVYLVRNPLKRAHSHYCHRMRIEGYRPFETAMRDHPPILDCSRYASQLAHMQRFFPRENILLDTFDNFQKDAGGVVARLRRFLGLPAMEGSVEFKHSNRHSSSVIVFNRLRSLPGHAMMRRLLPSSVARAARVAVEKSPIGSMVDRRLDFSRVSIDLKKRLIEEFEPDIRAVEQLLGEDLRHWRAID